MYWVIASFLEPCSGAKTPNRGSEALDPQYGKLIVCICSRKAVFL